MLPRFTPSWFWPGKLKELEVGRRWLTNPGFLYFGPISFTFVLTKNTFVIAPSKSICSNSIWKHKFIWGWGAAEILSEETWRVQQPRQITPVCKRCLSEGSNKVLVLWMGFSGWVSSSIYISWFLVNVQWPSWLPAVRHGGREIQVCAALTEVIGVWTALLQTSSCKQEWIIQKWSLTHVSKLQIYSTSKPPTSFCLQ